MNQFGHKKSRREREELTLPSGRFKAKLLLVFHSVRVVELGILFLKLFWPFMRKYCSGDEGWKPRICKKIELTRTIHSNRNMSVHFLEQKAFPTCSWIFLRSNILKYLKSKLGKKLLWSRNLQEKLEKAILLRFWASLAAVVGGTLIETKKDLLHIWVWYKKILIYLYYLFQNLLPK